MQFMIEKARLKTAQEKNICQHSKNRQYIVCLSNKNDKKYTQKTFVFKNTKKNHRICT